MNQNGLQEAYEPGFEDVLVNLHSAAGTIISSRSTDQEGEYEFSTDPSIPHYVTVTAPYGYTFSPQNVNGNTQDSVDSDVNSLGVSDPFANPYSSQDWNSDAGLYLAPGSASIGDRVWEDTNGDGDQDAGEAGLTGVAVTLKNSDGFALQSTTTGANGAYGFSGVNPGDYSIVFAQPAGYRFTSGGPIHSLSVFAGEAIADVDAGLVRSATIGDRVWFDANGDGIQSAGES